MIIKTRKTKTGKISRDRKREQSKAKKDRRKYAVRSIDSIA